MIFRRKIYDKLLQWKEKSAGEKALMIEGARRIGKSTIVEEFGKNEYKSYLLIDFNDVSQVVKDAFEKYLNDLDTFFMILSTESTLRRARSSLSKRTSRTSPSLPRNASC